MAKDFPLLGKKIIITRAQEQNSVAHQLFMNNGAEVLDLPSLIIGPPDDWKPLDEALKKIVTFNWIIFSSANGVKNVEARLNKIDLSLSNISEKVKIASVGRKTANSLKAIDVKISFVPPKFIADSLIEYFPERAKGLKIFIPRVQTGGRSILSEFFNSKGSEVIEVAAYESFCPKEIPQKTIDALNSKNIDIIAFTSGKTVKNTSTLLKKYFGNNWLKIIENIKIVSIGPQTSISCSKILRKIDKEAEPHDLDGLLKACIQLT